MKLNLLCKFFKSSSLASICIKSEIIHSYFKNNINKEIDFNKLELFHLQFTDSLIDLLNKIKKNKEFLIVNYLDEINANKKYIDRFHDHDKFNDYEKERKFHSGVVSQFLKSYYKNLVGDDNELNLPLLIDFSSKWIDNFSIINTADLLLDNSFIKYYNYDNFYVQTKLLGKLNIKLFKVRFLFGFTINNNLFEVFKIFQSDDVFIWSLSHSKMYLISDELFQVIDGFKNSDSNQNINQSLELKNSELKNKINTIKNTIPVEVAELLIQYENNLENIDLLNNSLIFDEEANILKSMLNLKLNT